MQRDEARKVARGYQIGLSVFVLLFGIFWCVMVAASGVWFMLIFGLFFVAMAAYRLIMFIRLTGKERREKDPWEQPDRSYSPPGEPTNRGDRFCPYCGNETQEGFEFCPKCGRRLP